MDPCLTSSCTASTTLSASANRYSGAVKALLRPYEDAVKALLRANEKLQRHFSSYIFSLEVEEYQRENIEWPYADFQFQVCACARALSQSRYRALIDLQ
jgi:DNA repair ATPase RecN